MNKKKQFAGNFFKIVTSVLFDLLTVTHLWSPILNSPNTSPLRSVATSSGESCRSSSDSASSAPCSPESVLSDSGGTEGLPDSALASSGDRRRGAEDDEEEDEDDDDRRPHHHRLRDDAMTIGGGSPAPTTSDPCFALSRLLLLQQHCGGRDALPASPSDLRKRDRRLVDEVVAAATSSRGSSRGSRSSADHHQQQQQQQQVCATAVVPTLAKDGRSEEAAGAEQEVRTTFGASTKFQDYFKCILCIGPTLGVFMPMPGM